MSNEKNNSEDFLSLWRKKTASDLERPSAIGEALNQLEKIKDENEKLRNKINDNIELIKNSENYLKNVVDERDKLKSEKEQIINDSKKKNENLEWLLKQKEEEISLKITQIKNKDSEIFELKSKRNNLGSSGAISTGVNKSLIEDLQFELSKRKAEIEKLNNKLNAMDKSQEKPIASPKSSGGPSSPLEVLCQDLQSDLNRYKKMAEHLQAENQKLQSSISKIDTADKVDLEELNTLRIENKEFRERISELQNIINKNKIEDLRKKIEENDIIINELKETNKLLTKETPGPMKELIDELQEKINKLKITVNDQDRKIRELQKNK